MLCVQNSQSGMRVIWLSGWRYFSQGSWGHGKGSDSCQLRSPSAPIPQHIQPGYNKGLSITILYQYSAVPRQCSTPAPVPQREVGPYHLFHWECHIVTPILSPPGWFWWAPLLNSQSPKPFPSLSMFKDLLHILKYGPFPQRFWLEETEFLAHSQLMLILQVYGSHFG
jgi:hypothetical protein